MGPDWGLLSRWPAPHPSPIRVTFLLFAVWWVRELWSQADGLESWLPTCVAQGTQPLCALKFLICKMGMRITSNELTNGKCFKECLSHRRHSVNISSNCHLQIYLTPSYVPSPFKGEEKGQKSAFVVSIAHPALQGRGGYYHFID